MSESNMSKADIPKEVDFRGGKRGVYAARYAAGTNMIVLDPDVARRFKTSDQVNRVLRTFIDAAAEIAPRRHQKVPKSSARQMAKPKRAARG
ncbi:MAG: hypothetical protein JO036_18755 [Candidatus Eremiobacteraeota bacterium]|nr:hypothetical protein [Candidatus Eremiobacteraeota bacterium]